MIIYKDLLTGDELLSDSYDMKESDDGFWFEVAGKWIVVGPVDVDIGANPTQGGGEGCEDADEGVADEAKRVVDIIDAFRLVEQPSYDKKGFMGWVKPWLGKVKDALPDDKKDEFQAKAPEAIKMLLGKLNDLQFFTGESMDAEGTMVFAIYKDGASDPTFYFPKYALKEEKC